MRPLAVAALLLLGLWCALFLGTVFHPTDYEFVPATVYRLLHGQMIYRDVIWHKPPLTLLLHWLVDPTGPGSASISRVYVLAQFVAFGFGPVAWAVHRGYVPPGWRAALFAAGGSALALHNFPVCPWYTTDGVLFCTAGAVLAAEAWSAGDGWWRWLAGASACFALGCLCKQSFLPAALAFGALALWRWRWRALAPALLPATTLVLACAAWLWRAGALRDALEQLTSDGYGAGHGLSIALEVWRGFGGACFVWMALLLGLGLWRARGVDAFGALHGLLLATAWSAEVSIGYPSPLLGLAGLGVVLARERRLPALRLALAAAALVGGLLAQWCYPYRDASRSALLSDSVDLGRLLPKLQGIRTNPATFARYEDLRWLFSAVGGRPLAVTQDYPGAHWLTDTEPPWAIDWDWPAEAWGFETRLWEQLNAGDALAVVPKEAGAPELPEVDPPSCQDVDFSQHAALSQAVVRLWEPVGETRYFCLFERQAR